jgi:ABC-type amino acid transport substrate-binding protein
MIRRRTFSALTLVALAALGSTSLASAQEKVVVGVVTYSPPMSYQDGDTITGYSNDILQRVAELEGFEIDYVPLKFDALIPSIQAGQIDIAVAAIFITEERQKIVAFSDPYYQQGAILVAPYTSSITSVADLKGKTLAAEQGSAALRVADSNADEWGVDIRILQDAPNMQLAMQTGDVDAMIYDSALVAYQIDLEGDKPTIKTISDVIKPTGVGFAFPKESKWIATVNSGLATMEANGDLTALKQKYKLD